DGHGRFAALLWRSGPWPCEGGTCGSSWVRNSSGSRPTIRSVLRRPLSSNSVPVHSPERTGTPGLFPLPAPATAAVTTPGAAGAAPAALGPGFGLIDGQGAALDLFQVHLLGGLLRLGVAAHLDEAEAFGLPRGAVHDDLRRLHRAVRGEQLLQHLVGHGVGQIAYVQLLAHEGLLRERDWHATARVGRVMPGITVSRGTGESCVRSVREA